MVARYFITCTLGALRKTEKGEEGIYGQLNDKNPSSMGVMEGGRDGKAIVEGVHGRVQRAQLMIVPLPLLCHCKKGRLQLG